MQHIEKTRVERVNELHIRIQKRIHKVARASIKDAIEIGRLLKKQKENAQHGNWLPWVESNLSFSPRQARRYIRAFDNRDYLLKSDTGADLSLKQAMKALAEPAASKEKTPIPDVIPSWLPDKGYMAMAHIPDAGGVSLVWAIYHESGPEYVHLFKVWGDPNRNDRNEGGILDGYRRGLLSSMADRMLDNLIPGCKGGEVKWDYMPVDSDDRKNWLRDYQELLKPAMRAAI